MTIVVVLLLIQHLRSSILISGLLPLAVLLCFIAMKLLGVDANIVALSGIAIAIGTMVTNGIFICENILRHFQKAGADENRLTIIYRSTREVGGAVVTAALTTIVSFLPVFSMIGPEGKLFKPLAFTKTFALAASILVALTILPAAAYYLFPWKKRDKKPQDPHSPPAVLAGYRHRSGGCVHRDLVGGCDHRCSEPKRRAETPQFGIPGTSGCPDP